MIMRCRFYTSCDIIDCPHYLLHEHNLFCDKDERKATCGGGDDPYCLPVNKMEAVRDILSAHLSKEGTEEVTAQILAIFGEAA